MKKINVIKKLTLDLNPFLKTQENWQLIMTLQAILISSSWSWEFSIWIKVIQDLFSCLAQTTYFSSCDSTVSALKQLPVWWGAVGILSTKARTQSHLCKSSKRCAQDSQGPGVSHAAKGKRTGGWGSWQGGQRWRKMIGKNSLFSAPWYSC